VEEPAALEPAQPPHCRLSLYCFVPILLILTLVFLAGRILYSQLGAYLLHEDIQQRIDVIADISEHIAVAHQTLSPGITQEGVRAHPGRAIPRGA